MKKLTFYLSTGLLGVAIIPSLYIMAVVFAFCAVFLIGYTLVALFINLPDIINIGSMILTGIPAFITAVVTGGILLALAVICRKNLKKYLAFVSTRYHQLHPEQ